MRIIIAGSREFTDYYRLREKCMDIIGPLLGIITKENIEIVSGGAQGADRLGQSFAKEFHLKLTVMPAQWDKYGKSAGYRRNLEMAKYAMQDSNSMLIAFWNGFSKGTQHMIDIAKEKGMYAEIINV